MLWWFLVACTSSTPIPRDTEETAETADTDVDTDTDTAPVGTDDDRDGWTVEAGDCVDDDIWINPGWPEQPNDNKDNDCDGRTDEVFDGVVVLQTQDAGAENTKVQVIDALGDPDGTFITTAAPQLRWMEERRDAPGWVAMDPVGQLWTVSAAGTATQVWDAATLEDPPATVYGVAWHPDGYALTLFCPVPGYGGNALWRVDLDGTATKLADWRWFEEGAHDIAAISLAIDPLTREVVLFGVLGGVATWTEAEGLTVRVQEDPEGDATARLVDAHADERGRVYGLGWASDATGTPTGIWQLDRDTWTLDLKGRWVQSDLTSPIDFAPVSFAIVSDSSDFYVTANGGWYRTVWRVVANTPDSYATQLWTNVLSNPADPADAHRFFQGLAVRWKQDP